MERYVMLIDWKTQVHWSLQIDLQLEYNPGTNPSVTFCRKQAGSKINMEMQSTKNNQTHLKREKSARGLYYLI